MNLSNKTAIVCGCTKGIGLAIANLFAKKGCNLILFARNEKELASIQQRLINEYNIYVKYLVADFEHSEIVQNVIHDFIENTDLKIDILINNVGGDGIALLKDSSYKILQKTFNRHIIANHIISTAVISNMKKHNTKGKIINICSNTAISPYLYLGLYSIRTAESGYMKTLAMELAQDGISVNNVVPGAVDTPGLNNLLSALAHKDGVDVEENNHKIFSTIPFKRPADPLEIANVVLMLASDENSYMTGSSIKIDGGLNFTV